MIANDVHLAARLTTDRAELEEGELQQRLHRLVRKLARLRSLNFSPQEGFPRPRVIAVPALHVMRVFAMPGGPALSVEQFVVAPARLPR